MPIRIKVHFSTVFLTFFIVIQLTCYAQYFSRVTNAGAIVTDSVFSAGSSWNDYNNDGYLDMFTSESPVHMYKNNGDGTFSAMTGNIVSNPFTTPFGTVMATWADFNNDGYQDIYRANYGLFNGTNPTAPLKDFLFKNGGPPNYEMSLVDLGNDSSFSTNATWIDYDHDGDVDLFVFGARNTQSLFYRNDGGDNFTRLTSLPFLITTPNGGTDTWVDYDNDGDMDLYLVFQLTQNKLFKSLLSETGNADNFELVESSVLSNEGGVFDITASWGDYNNDGYFDAHLAVAGGNDKLFMNNGDGTFTNVTGNPIVSTNINTSFGAWADFDNDGDIDLVTTHVANGLGQGSSDLFRNDGNGIFVQLTNNEAGDIVGSLPSPQAGSWGDYDNDGDMDFYVVNFALPNNFSGTAQPNYLFKNNLGNNNNWLMIKCEGMISNRSAIGTIVRVKANINGNSFWQKKFISAGALGNTSQADLRAHFGLGNASVVDSLVIEWTSGIIQTIKNVNVNQILTVVEDFPLGYIRADFIAEPTDTINSDTLTVHFEDRSFSVSPVISWQWDFNGDGIFDSYSQNPDWTYTAPGFYTVSLLVFNQTLTDTLTRENFIYISGLVPLIEVNSSLLNLGDLDVNLTQVDTTFYIRNKGGETDSIYLTIDPANVNPPSAISVSPIAFEITANDSQLVTISVHPNLINPGFTFYNPKVLIDSRFGYGNTHFEKPLRFRVNGVLSSDDPPGIPSDFNLYQNYPNPFNPSTTIKFDLPETALVKATVFDVLGRRINDLINEELPPSRYTILFKADGLSSGIYIYQVQAFNNNKILFSSSKQMILLK